MNNEKALLRPAGGASRFKRPFGIPGFRSTFPGPYSAPPEKKSKRRPASRQYDAEAETGREFPIVMTSGALQPLLQFLYGLAPRPGERDATDRDLLNRFTSGRDEAAFAALLHRHGPMALAACRRILGTGPDAEDAFQSAFLVLARKARSISRPERLGGWLYGVACRCALEYRTRAARRRTVETRAAVSEAVSPETDQVDWADLRPVLDEEINRLPERYRTPFVLCYLEGRTNEEAARILGRPKGTVLSRLAWARRRLRVRIARRGLAPATALAVAAGPSLQAAVVPTALAAVTVQAGLLFRAADLMATGLVTGHVVVLAERVARSMAMSKTIMVALALLTAGALALGGGLLARTPVPSEQTRTEAGTHEPAQAEEDPPKEAGAAEPAKAEKDLAKEKADGRPAEPTVLPAPRVARPGLRATLPGHMDEVRAVFSSDGRTLAAVSGARGNYSLKPVGNGEVKFWDVATEKNTATLRRGDALHRWRVQPRRQDAGHGQTGRDDNALGPGHAAGPRHSGGALHRLRPRRPVQPGRQDPGDAGRAVQFWDVNTHKNTATLPVPWAGSLAFSPDGRTLATTGDRRGGVQLWDSGDGQANRRARRYVHPGRGVQPRRQAPGDGGFRPLRPPLGCRHGQGGL